jgi:RNAse (barnase) inhibitor barstar
MAALRPDPRLFDVETSFRPLLRTAEPAAVLEEAQQWSEAGLTVRTVRGAKMRTARQLFDEFAAALQFPDYFGENWDALDECLADLDWLSIKVGAVLVVRDAEQVLLEDEPDRLEVLVAVLARATATLAAPIKLGEWWDRAALSFHVVLQASAPHAEATRARWGGAGAEPADL